MRVPTALLEERDAVAASLDVLATAALDRALTDEQRSQSVSLREQLAELDERIATIEAATEPASDPVTNADARDAAVSASVPTERQRVQVSERSMYGKEGQRSWFSDIRAAGHGDVEARQRLLRSQELEHEEMERRGLVAGTDSAGGYFVAPLDLQDEFVNQRRYAAVAAGLVTNRPLYDKTDTIRLPKLATGTAAAIHTEGAVIQKTDAVLGQVEARVKRILGGQDVANFLLDRGTPDVDEIVMADLAGAVYEILDELVLHADITGWKGLTTVAEDASKVVAYTDASPTWGELYGKIVAAVAGVSADVKRYPTGIIEAPRRFGWQQGQVDSEGRPLMGAVVPANAIAETPSAAAEGARSTIAGVKTYTDGNMRVNSGAGTNEDDIIVGVMEEAILWSGALMVGFSNQQKFDEDETVFKAGIDAAFMADRRDGAFYVVQGTGLIPTL